MIADISVGSAKRVESLIDGELAQENIPDTHHIANHSH
jgi:hypothetical protein